MSKSTTIVRKGTDTPFRPRPDVELCKRGERRCERFLDAATDVFLEKGYRQTRLSDIVARAGGSMATLYRVFGDKEGLAHAIIERHMAVVAEQLQALNLSGLPPEIALRQTGESIINSILTRESVLIHRIVIGERHMNALGRRHRVGRRRRDRRTELFERARLRFRAIPHGDRIAPSKHRFHHPAAEQPGADKRHSRHANPPHYNLSRCAR